MATLESKGKPKLGAILLSPVGKKVLTGITGIALVLFVILHMIGNLGYFEGGGAYNLYSDFLLSTGPLLIVIEVILLIAFLLHAYLGLTVYLGKRRARRQGYSKYESAGRPSLQTVSSRSMIFTGIVLFLFTIIHLISFKYGPGIEEGYIADATTGTTLVQGESLGADAVEQVGEVTYIRDLRRLVTERFQSPWYTFGYLAVMILLGLHLRHGIWSAFQSLGTMNPRLTPLVYTIGVILAILIAVGFFVLPLYIFFFVEAPLL